MNITVLFFGMLAEATQTSRLELDTNSSNLTDLETEVTALFPGLKKMSFKLALNENLVTGEAQLTPQARVAFLPPFAGG